MLKSGAYGVRKSMVTHLREIAKVRGEPFPKLGQAILEICTQDVTGKKAFEIPDLDGKQWHMLFKGQFYLDYMADRRQALYDKAVSGTSMTKEERLAMIAELRET